MTKKEIARIVAEKLNITQQSAKLYTQTMLDAIVSILEESGRIELRNFGIFEVRYRPARKARNPRTGKKVDVTEKWVVSFKPGKNLEENLQKKNQEKSKDQKK